MNVLSFWIQFLLPFIIPGFVVGPALTALFISMAWDTFESASSAPAVEDSVSPARPGPSATSPDLEEKESDHCLSQSTLGLSEMDVQELLDQGID